MKRMLAFCLVAAFLMAVDSFAGPPGGPGPGGPPGGGKGPSMGGGKGPSMPGGGKGPMSGKMGPSEILKKQGEATKMVQGQIKGLQQQTQMQIRGIQQGALKEVQQLQSQLTGQVQQMQKALTQQLESLKQGIVPKDFGKQLDIGQIGNLQSLQDATAANNASNDNSDDSDEADNSDSSSESSSDEDSAGEGESKIYTWNVKISDQRTSFKTFDTEGKPANKTYRIKSDYVVKLIKDKKIRVSGKQYQKYILIYKTETDK